MTFVAGPALAKATRSALQIFARHKPTIFKLANDESDAGRAFVSDYARGLVGVTLEAITEAAQRWVAHKTDIPSPASFGMFARGIDAAEFRATAPPGQSIAAKRERWPGSRAFWFPRDAPKDSAGQWDDHHAIAFSVPGVGSSGISEQEMDRLHSGDVKWGWIDDVDLPAWALDMMGRPRPAARAAQPMESLLTEPAPDQVQK